MCNNMNASVRHGNGRSEAAANAYIIGSAANSVALLRFCSALLCFCNCRISFRALAMQECGCAPTRTTTMTVCVSQFLPPRPPIKAGTVLLSLFISTIVKSTTILAGDLLQPSNLSTKRPRPSHRADPPYDKDACPNQSHWIFFGVLVGLGTGILVLWLLNCFHLPARDTEERSNNSVT